MLNKSGSGAGTGNLNQNFSKVGTGTAINHYGFTGAYINSAFAKEINRIYSNSRKTRIFADSVLFFCGGRGVAGMTALSAAVEASRGKAARLQV